ncbi:hypothetical protein PT7_2458 [Pusillimonas sp. T7-7]|nr:hypothetical protein PT7_2458 [Pusillimonas sp. T7-7]
MWTNCLASHQAIVSPYQQNSLIINLDLKQLFVIHIPNTAGRLPIRNYLLILNHVLSLYCHHQAKLS